MNPGGGRLEPPQAVVERALTASRGDGCVVIVVESEQAEVRFANNTTTTNGVRRDRRVAVVSVQDLESQPGVSPGVTRAAPGAPPAVAGITSASGSADVIELLRRAEAEASSGPAAPDAAALVVPGDAPAGGASFEEPPASTGPQVLAGVVAGLADAFHRARVEGNLLAGFAAHSVETVYLGSSTGLRLRYDQPEGTMELVARSADGTRSAWAGAGTSSFEDIDVEEFEARLRRRLGWAKRAVSLPAGRYEVILPPDATADFMVPLSEAMSGRDAEEGRSPFSAPGGGTRIGDALCPSPFDLHGDPSSPGLESPPFLVATASGTDVSVFDNGMRIAPTSWIEGGRLQRLRYHRAGAASSGGEPTAPVGNLILELPRARADLDDMVRTTERGLLLTCLWYIREVDPVTLLLTGLTRDGVYLIEHGEVVGAVNNFRFNESPLDILARTMEAGASVRALSREWGEWMNRTAMPPLRIADFNMSSVSPAT